MSLADIANELKDAKENVLLAYAFNATGKTQLSVAYKDATKTEEGQHTGVYYNALSEDIFIWDNGDENRDGEIRLIVRHSSLSQFHSLLNEQNVREKLFAFKPKFDFEFELNDDSEQGIDWIAFFVSDDKNKTPIKISRGEERIFVWCFFLALFEIEGWADEHSSHFFIDDPVSSLDDHNIFVTASTIYDLIESQFEKRKIILTTHHVGLFSILADWLKKGEKRDKFSKATKLFILSSKSGKLSLESCRNDVFLYHLRLLQILDKAQQENDVRAYHFALLRQVLENVGSFLGVGQFGYVLNQIGIDDPDEVAGIVNTLSHKKVYYYETDTLVPDTQDTFDRVLNGLKEKYKFVLHAN